VLINEEDKEQYLLSLTKHTKRSTGKTWLNCALLLLSAV